MSCQVTVSSEIKWNQAIISSVSKQSTKEQQYNILLNNHLKRNQANKSK